MVKYEQVTEGALSFAETAILSGMTGWRKGAGATILALFAHKAEAVMDYLVNNKFVSMLGLIDNGMVDVDAVIIALKESIRRNGNLSFELPFNSGTITLNEAHIDELHKYIMNASA